jgi:hypothetical protein
MESCGWPIQYRTGTSISIRYGYVLGRNGDADFCWSVTQNPATDLPNIRHLLRINSTHHSHGSVQHIHCREVSMPATRTSHCGVVPSDTNAQKKKCAAVLTQPTDNSSATLHWCQEWWYIFRNVCIYSKTTTLWQPIDVSETYRRPWIGTWLVQRYVTRPGVPTQEPAESALPCKWVMWLWWCCILQLGRILLCRYCSPRK